MSEYFSIAIAGLGNVGSATVNLLEKNKKIINKKAGIPIKIKAVSARRKSLKRNIKLCDYDWESNAEILSKRKDIDLVVELIGGEKGIANKIVMSSLKEGKHVVTANKALLANNFYGITKLITGKKIGFYFEAAVAAAIPIINSIQEGISSNQINGIQAILNGTCNFILSDMKNSNSSFEEALLKAQNLGYAESDPTFDVEGIDSSQKLSILSMLAFGAAPEPKKIYTEGIRLLSDIDMKYAEKLGYSIKLICIANFYNEQLDLRVHPALLAEKSIASHVNGALNTVILEGDFCNKLTFIGEGAGPFPTASSVVSDIIKAAKNRNKHCQYSLKDMKKYFYKPIEDREGAYYIRFLVEDTRGVISTITAYLNENNISLDSIIQDSDTKNKSQANIIVITHETKEKNIIKSIKLIRSMKTIVENPRVIRLEEI